MKLRIIMALTLLFCCLSAAPAGDVKLNDILNYLGYKPPRKHNQGWLEISNRDWSDYSVDVHNGGKRLQFNKHGRGKVKIPAGRSVTIVLDKGTWTLRSDDSRDISVSIRDRDTTGMSVFPVGRVGRTGLEVTVDDGRRKRTDTLFHAPGKDRNPSPSHRPPPPPPPKPPAVHPTPAPKPMQPQKPDNRPGGPAVSQPKPTPIPGGQRPQPGKQQAEPVRPGGPDNHSGPGAPRPRAQ